MVVKRRGIVYGAAVIRALPEPGIPDSCKDVIVQAGKDAPVHRTAIGAGLIPEGVTQVGHLGRVLFEVSINIGFYAGVFRNGSQFKLMTFEIKVVTCLHTHHPGPLGLNVIILDQAHRAFHVIQEKFRIDTHKLEQAVVQVKSQSAVIAVFGIVPLFHEQGRRRHKEPGLHVVVEHRQFADADGGIPYGQLITVAEQVSRVVLVFHAHAVVVNAQVRIKTNNAQRTKPHVHSKHVVREGKLVQGQVVVVAWAPVHHVSAQINTQPVVIEAKMGTVAGITGILHTRIIFFFLDLYKFPVKRFWRCRRVGFIIDAGIQHKINGIRIATQVDTAVDSRPNCIAKGFSPTVVDTAHHASSKGYTGRTSVARIQSV